MNSVLKASAAAVVALAAFVSQASAFGLVMPTDPKFKVTKAQLGIISPANNTCPGNGVMTAWLFGNQPGTVDILIVRKGGNVAGPYTVSIVEGANGVFMGSYTKPLNIVSPIDAEYRVVIPNSDVASNWAPLVATC